MIKLTQKEASNLISKAWHDVHKYSLGGYRFGQALFNLLPNGMGSAIVNTDKDFFYFDDSEKATELFYKHCVEE